VRAAAAALTVAVATAVTGVALAAHRTIARPQAKAVATAINLRHGDLPGYAQHPNPITKQEEQIDAQLSKCTGTSQDAAALAKVQSPSFDSPGAVTVSVGSTAMIATSASVVASDLKAVSGPKALDCIGNELRSQLKASLAGKATLISLHGSKIASVVSGSDGTFAYRFAFVLGVKQGKKTIDVPAYGDFIGFAWGQAEVSLSVETELTPPPAALERRLAALLVTRAHAAIG
jgi:hypothetical protein